MDGRIVRLIGTYGNRLGAALLASGWKPTPDEAKLIADASKPPKKARAKPKPKPAPKPDPEPTLIDGDG